MGRASTTFAAATASLVLLAAVTYAAVQSVDTNPDAQVVIPSSPTASRHPAGSTPTSRPARPTSPALPAAGGSDDRVEHDSGDDRDRERGDGSGSGSGSNGGHDGGGGH